MRKGLLTLPAIIAAGLLPMAASAADVCNRVTGKGLFNGVCQECLNEGRCQIADIFIVGNSVVKLILGLSGSIMLLMVIYGGFLWLASSGNSGMIDKGKKVLIGAVIGLIIVFGAYTAVQFLVAALVCTGGSSCTVVNEIFSRPFQAVTPPGGKTSTPAPATGGNQVPTSGNPTAGEPTSGSNCLCVANITGGNITAGSCSAASVKGVTCKLSGSGGACDCSGNLQVGQSECSADGFKNAIVGTVPGVDVSGGCNWQQ